MSESDGGGQTKALGWESASALRPGAGVTARGVRGGHSPLSLPAVPHSPQVPGRLVRWGSSVAAPASVSLGFLHGTDLTVGSDGEKDLADRKYERTRSARLGKYPYFIFFKWRASQEEYRKPGSLPGLPSLAPPPSILCISPAHS